MFNGNAAVQTVEYWSSTYAQDWGCMHAYILYAQPGCLGPVSTLESGQSEAGSVAGCTLQGRNTCWSLGVHQLTGMEELPNVLVWRHRIKEPLWGFRGSKK